MFIKTIGASKLAILVICVASPSCKSCKQKNLGSPFSTPPNAGVLAIGSPNRIVVDQFGYTPDARKVAIVKAPRFYLSRVNEQLPAPPKLEVRRFPDGRVVYSGHATIWCNGAVDEASGDRGYWFDFTELNTPGEYVVIDASQKDESVRFSISPDVYRNILKASVRAFYFNRANIEKVEPYACVGTSCWKIAKNYLGEGQDRNARSVYDKNNKKTERDMSGGWWDAGDVNKYVTFARYPVHQLLTAYQERSHVFTDDFGIPESGNGVSDLLDEVKVELEWVKRMQPVDLGGGALPKIGNTEFGDPVPDQSRHRRYYYPTPCSSATIASAGMFAHASIVYSKIPGYEEFAKDLRTRAELAFSWQLNHPRSDNCDTGELKGGDSDRSLDGQRQDAVVAAIYLFVITGDSQYKSLFETDYKLTRPYHDDTWGAYDPDQGDALMYYTTLANANPSIVADIRNRRTALAETTDIFQLNECKDLYRSYLRKSSYHWGSNSIRANSGNSIYDLLLFRLSSPTHLANYNERSLGLLQHFHGVNALALVYLSNMNTYGAERSVSEIFHAWFRDGDPIWDSSLTSQLGPAPGFVVGGPNAHYCENQPALCAKSELRTVPVAKAYRDFNTGWAPQESYDRSWELSEPSIGYQAAYVKLLSKFVK
jgi:hypothetical protein